MDTFLLVDASSYLFRAFYALPDLRSQQHFPTGAIWGVLNMLRRLRQDYPTTYGVCVFDPPGGNFRHALYEDYKANRGTMPEDLSKQVPFVLEITRLMGWPLVQWPGYEADDVIATLVKQATQQGYACLVSTGDKDLAQLVSPTVHLINTMTGERLDPEGVVRKFGVGPDQVADYLALMGDRVDNVPGVPGVGPKTAVKWLTQYGSLANVVAHAEEMKGKIGEQLRAHREVLPIVQQLVRLDAAVPLDQQHVEDYLIQPADERALQEHFRTLSFDSLLTTPAPSSVASTVSSVPCDTVAEWSDAVQMAVLYLRTSDDWAVLWGEVVYHVASPSPDLRAAIYARLTKVTVIVHDAKRCHHLMPALSDCQYEDVMLQSYILHSGEPSSLIALADRFSMPLAEEPEAAFLPQVCALIHRAYESQQHLLRNAQGEVVYRLECRLASVLAAMEWAGIALDTAVLAAYEERLIEQIQSIESEAYAYVGGPINLASPKQLQTVLFDRMGLPVIKKTAKGLRSTDEEVLYQLSAQSPFAALVLEHRGLNKMLNTYVHKLPHCVNPETGRIHTVFLQTGTVTGRLSSMNPNLQNIPIKGNRTVREAFVAQSGHVLISADYSQIELRILAHFSGDAALHAAFASGLDIHAATAQRIFHHDTVEEVTVEQRRFAKTLNFGLLYGMSTFGVAKQLHIAQEEAALFMKQYFDAFPAVQDYMGSVREKARQDTYVETLLGRRLYVKDINHSNGRLRQAAERAAINGPMQGSAADIIKIAMCAVCEALPSEAPLILQVHDELLIEAPIQIAEKLAETVVDIMSSCVTLSVPLVVNVGMGRHWDESHV